MPFSGGIKNRISNMKWKNQEFIVASKLYTNNAFTRRRSNFLMERLLSVGIHYFVLLLRAFRFFIGRKQKRESLSRVIYFIRITPYDREKKIFLLDIGIRTLWRWMNIKLLVFWYWITEKNSKSTLKLQVRVPIRILTIHFLISLSSDFDAVSFIGSME